MSHWAAAMWAVGYAVVLGFLLLTHLGRPPGERLSTRRFAVVLCVTAALPLLYDRALPVGGLVGDPMVGGLRALVVAVAFPVVWGLLFGAVGLVAYAVACGLPAEPLDARAGR